MSAAAYQSGTHTRGDGHAALDARPVAWVIFTCQDEKAAALVPAGLGTRVGQVREVLEMGLPVFCRALRVGSLSLACYSTLPGAWEPRCGMYEQW